MKIQVLMAALATLMGAGTALAEEPGERASFAALDVDGSGEITGDDMTALADARFAEVDTDGNGEVSEAEFVAHARARAAERATEAFQRLDVDGDGALSRDALALRFGRGRGQGFAERMIERADADGSGGISEAEFDTAREAMRDRWRQRADRHGRRHRR